MRFVTSPHPPGLIGYISSSTPRYYEFVESLERTEAPHDTRIFHAHSCNPASNSNRVVEEMGDAAWLWLLGDDHAWEPGLLLRLLAHDVDMVAPMVARRAPPWHPVAYAAAHPERTYSWREIGAADGLLPVAKTGTAGLLIRRSAFDKMAVTYGLPHFRVGTAGPDTIAEDLDFTRRAVGAGLGVYLDTQAWMEHLTTAAIVPIRTPGGRLELMARYGPLYQPLMSPKQVAA